MNYRHIYCKIISYAKSQEKLGLRKKGNGKYYERHHILPKSLFPLWENDERNLVLLTAREHFFCHKLLYKIYPCKEMSYALFYVPMEGRELTPVESDKVKSLALLALQVGSLDEAGNHSQATSGRNVLGL